jgi:hypothetical protein
MLQLYLIDVEVADVESVYEVLQQRPRARLVLFECFKRREKLVGVIIVEEWLGIRVVKAHAAADHLHVATAS